MSEKIDKIKQLVHIEEYAEYMGYHVKKKGHYYTLEEHDSVIINPATNRFFRNSSGSEYARGSIINFVMYFGHMDYKSAVRELEQFIGKERLESTPLLKPVMADRPKKKMLLLPPHGGNRRHVYAYLNKVRCIDTFVIDYFFASNHLYEDNKNNCVFVSYDEKTGRPDFACKRGTMSDVPFKGDVQGSSYEYCFRLPAKNGKCLYVCESVIDMMSLMTHFLRNGMEKKEMAGFHYQALGGTQKYQAVFCYLELHPEVDEVYLSFDNDQSGRETVQKVIETGKEKNCSQKFIPFLPEGEGMDWNDMVKEGSGNHGTVRRNTT